MFHVRSIIIVKELVLFGAPPIRVLCVDDDDLRDWICPECGAGAVFDSDKYEVLCPDCGLVLGAAHPYVAGFRVDVERII